MNLSIEKIINEFGQSILKICVGYCNSIDDAQDLYQDVLVNIWKGLDSFKGDSILKTWVFKIAINTCLLSLRKKRIKTIPFESLKHDFLSQSNINSDDNLRLDLLLKMIRRLPENSRSIMLLYLEGFSYKEISSIVGISVSNVGAKVSRTKRYLTKNLESNE